ncbi:MAG TPA: triose-phosphate isomerase [Bryobacteraceae bacterium]|nr:triose-phosphate isomerase [Bryobacterales bacterium]HRJ20156.1 triose-phosphate isomerase [Bryobacteraceae bacterium]
MRTPLMAGNWKMFKTPADTTAFFDKFLPLVAGAAHADVAICPPFINIPAAVAATSGSNVTIGAQNCYWVNKEGAFTGEVNAPMLKAAGCTWVIIGHSERRQFFGETDATVLQRTVAALEAGLKPIVCLGELLAERESGQTNEVLKTQFLGGIAPLTPEQFAQIVIAYEPVWAIGTGKVATPEIAEDTHRAIRALVEEKFGADAAAAVRILYGGSVKPDNVAGLMAQPNIDGALVGGAALKPEDFAGVVNFK